MPPYAQPDHRPEVGPASRIRIGDRIPVQTPDGALEVRRVVAVQSSEGVTFMAFEDHTAWAWNDDDPVLVLSELP